ncbi:MAG TPA: hypothetical protein DEP08_02680, partial [Candidatus Jacksonbacteria bacterium]|nr:hypothetical protein [Candidatus Jacksonbacteria bacterium]
MTPSLSLKYSSQNNANDSIFGYGWDMPIPSVEQIRSYTPNELYNPHNFMLNWFGDQKEVVPVGVADPLFEDAVNLTGGNNGAQVGVNGANSELVIAQSFTPSITLIEGIRLQKYGTIGSPIQDIQFTISFDRNNSPSYGGDYIAATSMTKSQWDNIANGAFFDVMFPKSAIISPGKKAWIVISATQGPSGRFPDGYAFTYNNASDTYPNGRLVQYGNNGVNWMELPLDLIFATLYTKTDNFGSYSAKVDSGEQFAISYQQSNTWEIKDKSGTKYTFGSTSASRNDDPLAPTRINSWLLDEIKDTRGNTIKYEYFKDKGRVYPKRIRYTGYEDDPGIYEIAFEPFASGATASNRLDPTISYAAGFKAETRYLVSAITIKVNGQDRRRYTFWYGNGDNKVRTLLTGIQEQGKSESGVLATFPKTTFSYQTKTPGWESAPAVNVTLPPQKNFISSSNNANETGGSFFLELNGDGRTDIYADPANLEAFQNTGNGTFSKIPWNKPFTGRLYNQVLQGPAEAFLLDINSDGLTDALAEPGAYLSNGVNGWIRAPEWDIPTNGGGRVADINGDGLNDFVYARYRSPDFDHLEESTKVVSLNTGHGFEVRQDYSIPIYFSYNSDKDTYQLLDVNGDRFVDIIAVDQTSESSPGSVYLNNGFNGWESTPSAIWKMTLEPFTPTPQPNQWPMDLHPLTRFADVNSDGFIDIIRSYNEMKVYQTIPDTMQINQVYLNNGVNGWTRSSAWENTIPKWFMTYVLDAFPNITTVDLEALIVDINGDDIVDVAESYYGFDPKDVVRPASVATEQLQSKYSRWHQNIYLGKGATPDVLTGITYPEDGSKNISYTLSNQYQNTRLPFPFLTVSQIKENDGLGNTSAVSYSYEGGYYYADSKDANENRFAGFHKVTTTREDRSSVVRYYHQGEGSADGSALGEYQDTIQKKGRLYREEVYEASGRKLAQTINRWDQQNQGYGVAFVFLASSVDTVFDVSGNHKDTASAYTYDGYGNIIFTTEYGEVNGKEDGSFTDTLSDSVTTNTTYAINTGAHIMGLPGTTIITDFTGTRKSETHYYYDNKPLWEVIYGNLTGTEQWWDTRSRYVGAYTSYNSFGLPVTATDPNN